MVALFEQDHPFSFPWPAHVFAVLNKYPNPLAPHVVSVDVVDRRMLEDGTIRSERLIGVQQDSPKWINKIIGQPDTTFVREVSFVVPSGTPNCSTTGLQATASTSLAHLEPPKLVMASTNLTLANLMQCRESISYLPHPWPNLPETTAAQFAPSLRGSSHVFDTRRMSSSSSSSSSPPSLSSHASTDSDSSLSSTSTIMPGSTLFSQSALIFTTGPLAFQPYPPHGISLPTPIEPLSQPRANTMPQRALGKKVEQWGKSRFETNAESGKQAMNHAAKTFWEHEFGQTF
ncbi:hypothetical protein OIO90_005357 [Microbotryomycetes sp. JL221]|nr:hypothetical protein OIO90_005357 [Microbotryomycetes sp. JL221]